MSQGKPEKLFVPKNSTGQNTQPIKLDSTPVKKLAKEVGNRKLAIISVNGNARTGKSLFLNNVVKYFTFGQNNDNWISTSTGDAGTWFKCDGGCSRVTFGMEVWSEPFYVGGGDGQEIGVILMDTQGLFDDQTDLDQNATIFALSSLLSSVMIYNTGGNLNDMDWQFLDLLSSFADLESQKKSHSALCFLLRDWQNTDEFPLGLHKQGCTDKSLIDFLFNIEGVFVDAAEARQAIKEKYSEIFAYTMPYPGKELAEEDNYDASVWSEDFRNNMKIFIEHLFSPENLFRFCKKVGTEEMTGNDFLTYVEAWERHFVNGSLPTVCSIYAATAEIQFQQGILQVQNKAKAFLSKLFEKGDQPVENFEGVLVNEFKSLEGTWEEKAKKLLGVEEYKEEYTRKLKEQFSILQRDYTLINEERKTVLRQKEEQRRIEEQRKAEEAQRLERERQLKIEQAAAAERARQEQERIRQQQLQLQQQLEDTNLETQLNANFRSQGKMIIVRVVRQNGMQMFDYDCSGVVDSNELRQPIRNISVKGNFTVSGNLTIHGNMTIG